MDRRWLFRDRIDTRDKGERMITLTWCELLLVSLWFPISFGLGWCLSALVAQIAESRARKP